MARGNIVLHGGNVATLDPGRPEAEAVAVLGERIVAVGSDDEVRRLAGSCHAVDRPRGRRLISGLMDNHTHYLLAGLARRR